ncbi:MAG: K(+)/H(+) antiporter NhaP [Bacteroidetes bacterium ADurb.Bin139]|nr:MAG: K(+)/H(+) antiporter NhaP [Bacteroidetes bacterium ADurb.Bin139]HOZ19002.1 potassium/proton antiporter [Bacteroidales bacterium]HPB77382.1 potassium/proton antiporter [Bacteroidales bacterium]HQN81155.1 potassium/proton antiporter [Bacteroidales bacterium]HQP64241.1 potassium/proton antiporter [Bacteroidales bacterium]
MAITAENILLIGSILLFFSLLAGKTGYKFGVPTLLLFLFVGMIFGSEGMGLQFSNPKTAQFIGVVALCVILFSGGMDTRYEEIKPIAAQGVILATLGVLLTAIFTSAFIYALTRIIPGFDLPLPVCLLLGSIMSSTDSASVFAILRSKGLKLKHNLRPLLELESGSNDPMAYMLTITLIQVIMTTGELKFWKVVLMFFYQMITGGLAGYLLGKLCALLMKKFNIENDSLYPILILAFCFFIYAFTDLVKGNGFLAVYIGGLVIGNSRFVHKKSVKNFFDGLSWLSQIIMFLALGLLVNPSELWPIAGVGLLIGIFMIILARPLAILLSLLPFSRMTMQSRIFTSWVGLRGAVPIIFATYPLVSGVSQANILFNIVFFITILSLLIQGTSIPWVARKLHVSVPQKKTARSEFEMEFSEDIKSAMSEVIVTEESLRFGNRMTEIPLPDKTLVVMVKRGDSFFIPRGGTEIHVGDKLLIISDDEKALRETYENLGLDSDI